VIRGDLLPLRKFFLEPSAERRGADRQGTVPSGSSTVRSSGEAEISLISRLRRSISAPRAGRRKTPTRCRSHNPERLASGGRFANAGCVCFDVTASALISPPLINGASVL
jgi:hypothetical protein